jgi:hypothetical protein
MEQLLVSDAVDQAIGQIDFSPLQGKSVFLDPEYVRTVRPLGFVNSDYVISSLRHQIVAAGCKLKDRREDAEIIVEPRVGSLGTDDYNIVYGLPRSEAAALAGVATNTGVSLPAIPEIAIGKSEYRQGVAKITVFAYRADDREAVWQSGVAKSTATSRDTWVMGAGPFQKGSIYRDKKIGGFNRVTNLWASSRQPQREPEYLIGGVYPKLVEGEEFELIAQGQGPPAAYAAAETTPTASAPLAPDRIPPPAEANLTADLTVPQPVPQPEPQPAVTVPHPPVANLPNPWAEPSPLQPASDFGQPRRR